MFTHGYLRLGYHTIGHERMNTAIARTIPWPLDPVAEVTALVNGLDPNNPAYVADADCLAFLWIEGPGPSTGLCMASYGILERWVGLGGIVDYAQEIANRTRCSVPIYEVGPGWYSMALHYGWQIGDTMPVLIADPA